MTTLTPISLPRGTAPFSRAEESLFVPWLVTTALAPVWFGSNAVLVWGVHGLIFGLLLTAYGIMTTRTGTPLPVPMSRLAWPLAAIGLVLFWAFMQMSPLVPAAWDHPIWKLAQPVVGHALTGMISVDPAATARAMLWTATVASNLVLAVLFAQKPGRSWTIVFAIALVAGAIAIYGLIVYFFGNQRVLWIPKFAYREALTATFINRNNYAAYCGISLIATIGLMLRQLQGEPPHRLESSRRSFRRWPTLALLGTIALLLCAALALTGSRAGALVTLLGIGVLALSQLPQQKRHWSYVLIAAIVASAAFFFMLPVGHLAIGRFAHFDQDLTSRLAVDERVVSAIGASPWLGYGYGSFMQAFPMFRDWTITPNAIWQYAHDDWLEALMTLGIPGGLLLWFIAIWALTRSFAGVRQNRHESIYAAIAASTCTLVMVHSMVDFTAQIQGVVLPLTTLIGVGLAQSWPRSGYGRRHTGHRQPLSVPQRPDDPIGAASSDNRQGNRFRT